MKIKWIVLVLTSGLVACGTLENSHYRNTVMLEKPPVLALQKTPKNAVIDDSIEPKKQLGGLDEKVVLLDESPSKLLLKLPVIDAWRLLGTAMRQSDMKVTDYDKAKHLYYVSYKSQGMLSGIVGFLNKDVSEVIYLLTLEPKDHETVIRATLASNHEQRESANNNPDGVYENPAEDSNGLIEHLFHVLRDDVKTE
ncbi:MAG: outer membrane protein assembly factor BamC [Methylococcaceae bacterium]|nr:outer membrane protein assembly factor BamC [Methylococcaceae bacterium]